MTETVLVEIQLLQFSFSKLCTNIEDKKGSLKTPVYRVHQLYVSFISCVDISLIFPYIVD